MGTDAKRDAAGEREPDPAPLDQSELEPVWLMGGVSLESVFGLLMHCGVVEHTARHVLISPERDDRVLYLLLRGALEVHLDPELSEPVARLEAGESVGEISVIDARRASAYVITAEPSRLLAVDETTFWRLVAASHAFASNLLFLLAQRMRANNRQLSASARRKRVLEREALTDALTGLYNRRWLEQRLGRLVGRHLRAGRPLSVMMLDIDHFKRFNDEFGHAMGDQVLAIVGKTVMDQMRPTDMAVRYGGEELVVILPDTPLDGARAAAERLRERIARTQLPNLTRTITVSIGLSGLEHDDDARLLLARADGRLYAAKAAGRDRVES